MRLPSGRVVRAALAVVTAVSAATLITGAPSPAAAVTAARRPTPAIWAERVCRGLVDFQAAALDARDVLRTTAAAPAPTDKATRRATVAPTRAAMQTVRARLRVLDKTLGGKPPTGNGGAAAHDALRTAMAPVSEAYAVAAGSVADLAEGAPAKVPRATTAVVARLDRSLDRATHAVTRSEKPVGRSAAGGAMARIAVCRSIGPEWSTVEAASPTSATKGARRTPTPPATTVDTPGAGDLTAPALLLPGRYRPTPEVAALAARTGMTGLSRTYFYGAMPEVETGSPFIADCPSADGANTQILGCYHDGHIYVLAVTRPEVAQIVAVTAAHEMLHAAYEAAPADDRAELDALLAAFYAASTDPRLRKIVGQYEQRLPANLPTELHSLVPTQVGTLTPELGEYYAAFFHDRAPVLADYESYISLFEGLIAQYDALHAQINDLKAQIASLRSQSDGTAGEAARLANQIDSLRAQGRVGESNALVGPQNDAVRRAQALNAQSNGLVDQHNALLDELNGIAAQLGGLESSLRPLG